MIVLVDIGYSNIIVRHGPRLVREYFKQRCCSTVLLLEAKDKPQTGQSPYITGDSILRWLVFIHYTVSSIINYQEFPDHQMQYPERCVVSYVRADLYVWEPWSHRWHMSASPPLCRVEGSSAEYVSVYIVITALQTSSYSDCIQTAANIHKHGQKLSSGKLQ